MASRGRGPAGRRGGSGLVTRQGDGAVGRRRAVAVGRRRAVALVVLALLLVLGVVAATSLARDEDAFSGVWWEPSSGRRVEIVREGDGFRLLYGAERRAFVAERRGDDELRIAAPLGGDILVRAVTADRLELIDGGLTTTLESAPPGS